MTENEAIIEEANEIAKGRMYATKALVECQKELEQYRAIGTVEECREAMEKMKPKRPSKMLGDYAGVCECGNTVFDCIKYCSNCGQAILWEE